MLVRKVNNVGCCKKQKHELTVEVLNFNELMPIVYYWRRWCRWCQDLADKLALNCDDHSILKII